MKLIVGLGNPGAQYEKTRHNIGFQILDLIQAQLQKQFTFNSKFECFELKEKTNNENVIFIKPTTYMNLSGNALIKVKNYFKVDTADILVIVDDINLPLGSVRIRESGSAGGHNGLKSIEAVLGTNQYKRIKIGCGKPNADVDLKDYVLANFSKAEQDILTKEVYPVAVDAIFAFIYGVEFHRITSKYNINAWFKTSWFFKRCI